MISATILLIGGTSETGAIAEGLAAAGCAVLVSTATDLPLHTGRHPAIRRRHGRLTSDEFAALIRAEGINAVVNAAHPFAADVRAATREAARRCAIPHFEFMRPTAALPAGNLHRAADHAAAARLAVRLGKKILLTIGVNNLPPYVTAARAAGAGLLARVLTHPASDAAARAAGLRDDEIAGARGAAAPAEITELIRRHRVDVLVTKDSGAAGGVPAKCAAAFQAGCAVVLVQRPPDDGAAAESIAELIARVRGYFKATHG